MAKLDTLLQVLFSENSEFHCGLLVPNLPRCCIFCQAGCNRMYLIILFFITPQLADTVSGCSGFLLIGLFSHR